MSMLADIVNNTPDPIVVPAGQSYNLQVTKAVFTATKGGTRDDGTEKPIRPMITLYLKILDEPQAQMVSESLWFPVDTDKEETIYSQNLKIKGALQALGIDPANDGDIDPTTFAPEMEPIPIPGWAGKTGVAVLGVQTYQDNTSNVVKSWIKPKGL